METVDCIVVGAGVVGLAIAEKLGTRLKNIIVVERHDSFGRESSSRNSEVIHAGLYYPIDSLRTRLCLRGNRLLYDRCAAAGIPYRNIGKIIISTNEAEERSIEKLFVQATENGVHDLGWISKNELARREPNVKARTAFFSATTGIIDSHALMKHYEAVALDRGVIIAYDCTVVGIGHKGDAYTVSLQENNGEVTAIESRIVINAAGVTSPEIASLVGIDVDKEDYRITPCKGEYFKIANRHRGKVNHLVYPAPTDISLGIHTVIDMSGALKLGPNAFFVDTIDYDIDVSHSTEFFESAATFLQFLKPEDLSPDTAGIRAKRKGKGFKDFIIREESNLGLPGWINLIGIESPGLTSSAAIAEYLLSFDVFNQF